MIIRDYKRLIKLRRIHTEQTHSKYAKVSFEKTILKETSMQSRILMINFDDYANESKIEHNLNWSYIPDHPHRILIIRDSGSGKTNALLNLINKQLDIDKIYLYAKDLYKAKYQLLINKRKSIGLKHFNYPKAFIEYSNNMQDVYKNIDEYNPGEKSKILIVFDEMIANMIKNKKFDSVVTDLFIRGRKLNISRFYYVIIFQVSKRC